MANLLPSLFLDQGLQARRVQFRWWRNAHVDIESYRDDAGFVLCGSPGWQGADEGPKTDEIEQAVYNT